MPFETDFSRNKTGKDVADRDAILPLSLEFHLGTDDLVLDLLGITAVGDDDILLVSEQQNGVTPRESAEISNVRERAHEKVG